MRKLSDTISRLKAFRAASPGTAGADRLVDLPSFGSNPGALRARAFVPDGLATGAPLVVVLHGCTQTAAGYDIASGWSDMAERHGFALLFPEQRRENNGNLCFNWFAPEDVRRGSGEALSIREMVAAMVDMHAIDPSRIFVTGLSAGGAMASAMLATYPDIFAGGAIIAGLPYACANSVPEALDRMRGHGIAGEAELVARVRAASDHRGPWPILSVWHGTADMTVDPVNADAIIAQWRSLHGVGAAPSHREMVDGYPRRRWHDVEGRPVIEAYSITGMGHGTPLDTLGEDGCGRSGPHMLEVGLSSTGHICRFWGLTNHDRAVVQDPRPEGAAVEPVPVAKAARPVETPLSRADARGQAALRSSAADVGKVIEDALRAAGLMR